MDLFFIVFDFLLFSFMFLAVIMIDKKEETLILAFCYRIVLTNEQPTFLEVESLTYYFMTLSPYALRQKRYGVKYHTNELGYSI